MKGGGYQEPASRTGGMHWGWVWRRSKWVGAAPGSGSNGAAAPSEMAKLRAQKKRNTAAFIFLERSNKMINNTCACFGQCDKRMADPYWSPCVV